MVIEGDTRASYAYSISQDTFVVLDDFVPPEGPAITSAQFATDGSSITVTFGAETNKALRPSAKFNCPFVFEFVQASESSCYWTDTKTVVIYPPPRNPEIVPGSTITLLANKVKAACTRPASECSGSTWHYSATQNVQVSSPATPLYPSVTFSAPSSIGSCLNLVLSLAASTGNGGRVWTSRTFTVVSNN